MISHSLRRVRPTQEVFDGTQTEQTHTQLTKTRQQIFTLVQAGISGFQVASGGGYCWLSKAPPPQISEGEINGARSQLQWKATWSSENSQNSASGTPGPAAYVAFLRLRCRPAADRGQRRDPLPRGPSCVSLTPVTICLLFVLPLPPFNCWMSLQSCVPKTINSREQSYTKKGVSPEGDGYPWKPPPFHSSLGEARMKRTVWGEGGTLCSDQRPRKCWGCR